MISLSPVRFSDKFSSLDTVRLTIPLSEGDLALLKPRVTTTYHPAGPEAPTNYKNLWLAPLSVLDRQASSQSYPVAAIRRDSLALDVQFSLPKTIYGHNVRHCGDLRRFCQSFLMLLRDWGLQPPDWDTWLVRRFDIPLNFVVQDSSTAVFFLDKLSRLRYRSNPSHRDSKHSSFKYPWAYWKNEYKTIKFYCKGPEMRAHKKDYSDEFLSLTRPFTDKIIRLEVEYHSKSVVRFCGVQTINDCTVNRFLKSFHNFDYLKHIQHMSRSFDSCGFGNSLAQAREIINLSFRKPMPYLDFIDQVIDQGFDNCKRIYNKSTFHRIVKKLREIGIEPALFEVLERVEDLSGFISVDNLVDLEIEAPLYPFQQQFRQFWDLLDGVNDFEPIRLTRHDYAVTDFFERYYSDKTQLHKRVTADQRIDKLFDILEKGAI